jgi:hypothetical protein
LAFLLQRDSGTGIHQARITEKMISGFSFLIPEAKQSGRVL